MDKELGTGYKALLYIKECAELVGLEVIEGKTAFDVIFMAEIMKRMREEREPKILETLDFAIDASNGDTNYFVGFRNGLRYAKSLIDGEEEPPYESCNETLSILDCAKKIKEHCTNAKWCFDCELGNGDGTCKLSDNEYCYSLPNEWKLEEETE